MAVKAAAQTSGQFSMDSNGDLSINIYIKNIPGGEDGVFGYGPVAPNQFTEQNLIAWIKETANSELNAGIGMLDTVKLVSGIGGIL